MNKQTLGLLVFALGALSLTLVLCLWGQSNRTDAERVEKGKSLCCSQGGLWYIYDDTAHCNNGANFFYLDKIVIYDKGCGK